MAAASPGQRILTYRPSATGREFHACDAEIKGVLGPVGSGKSVMCVWDIVVKSSRQLPNPYDKVRRSKWLVLRNTYRQLVDTTIATWLDWFPQTEMHWSSPLSGVYRFPGMTGGKPDGTTVEVELNFMALDDEAAVRNLKSLEVTGVYANEAGEMPWLYLSRAYERAGRYPKADDMPDGSKFKYKSHGMVMDTNPPSDTSWWYQLAEVRKPDGFRFFRQPPAVLRRELNGKVWYEPNDGRDPTVAPAENIENLNEGWHYYMKQVADGDHARIKVFLMGDYGTTVSGDAVYPEYRDTFHYVDEDLEVYWGLPLILGTDFGRTPSTVICQMNVNGQFRVIEDVVSENMGITTFTSDVLRPKLFNEYRLGQVLIQNFGDPAGNDPGQVDEQTCIQVMNSLGIPTVACPVPRNSFVLRREAVANLLRQVSDGAPGIVVGRKARNIREGFRGRYYYRKLPSADAGESRTASEPEKNRFSHPHDALQYAAYGATQGGGGSLSLDGRRSRGLYLPSSRRNDFGTAGRIDVAGFF